MNVAEEAVRNPAPVGGRVPGRLQTIVVLAVTGLVIAVVAILMSGALGGGTSDVQLSGNATGAVAGGLPPGFTATTYDGKKVSLADYAGKPLWLQFGGSWCPDCRVEAPDVEAAYEKYKAQGLNVLAVFIAEPASDIAAYAGRAGLTFPIAVDERSAIAGTYHAVGYPTHVFIGADGRIRSVLNGALKPSDMDREIAAILPAQ